MTLSLVSSAAFDFGKKRCNVPDLYPLLYSLFMVKRYKLRTIVDQFIIDVNLSPAHSIFILLEVEPSRGRPNCLGTTIC